VIEEAHPGHASAAGMLFYRYRGQPWKKESRRKLGVHTAEAQRTVRLSLVLVVHDDVQ
jgi:hypothetical protein